MASQSVNMRGMYFDPGSTGLLIQAFFAVIAAVFSFFGRAREWVVTLVTRAFGALRAKKSKKY